MSWRSEIEELSKEFWRVDFENLTSGWFYAVDYVNALHFLHFTEKGKIEDVEGEVFNLNTLVCFQTEEGIKLQKQGYRTDVYNIPKLPYQVISVRLQGNMYPIPAKYSRFEKGWVTQRNQKIDEKKIISFKLANDVMFVCVKNERKVCDDLEN